ncbi:MAG: hypothetical protein AAFX93_11850 [Verrucomicrobiota bacterium]
MSHRSIDISPASRRNEKAVGFNPVNFIRKDSYRLLIGLVVLALLWLFITTTSQSNTGATQLETEEEPVTVFEEK